METNTMEPAKTQELSTTDNPEVQVETTTGGDTDVMETLRQFMKTSDSRMSQLETQLQQKDDEIAQMKATIEGLTSKLAELTAKRASGSVSAAKAPSPARQSVKASSTTTLPSLAKPGSPSAAKTSSTGTGLVKPPSKTSSMGSSSPSPKRSSISSLSSAAKTSSMRSPSTSAASTTTAKTSSVSKSPSAGRVGSRPPSAKRSSARMSEGKAADGEESGHVRRSSYWIGRSKLWVYAPESFDDAAAESKTPRDSLQRSFVHGFNGEIRDNLFTNSQGHLVYASAALGLVYDKQSQQQRNFAAHNDDITCIAAHPNGQVFATGQLDPKGATKAYVCLWNSETMQSIGRIEFHARGVCGVAFSPDGQKLVTIGEDDSHTLAVWDWENDLKQPKAQGSASKDKVFGVKFNPSVADGSSFVTVGVKAAKFWTLQPAGWQLGQPKTGSTLNKVSEVQKAYMCLAFSPSDGAPWIGTHTGDIYIFAHNELEHVIKAHDTTIGSILALEDGMVTGGYDGLVKKWNLDHSPAWTCDLGAIGCAGTRIRSLVASGSQLLLGTRNNQIIECDLKSGQNPTIIADNHFKESWALAAHPTDASVYASGGNDKQVMVWDANSRTLLPKVKTSLPDEVLSVAFSGDGSLLACGLSNGAVVVLQYPSLQVQHELVGAHTEQVSAVQFSPDSTLLATGSWDQSIALHNTSDYSKARVLKGFRTSVTHMQFSADGQYIMANSKDYEILFFEVASGAQITRPQQMADVEFKPWRCILGWPVQGIWPASSDGTDINALALNASQTKIVTVDDFGLVKLFNAPCLQKQAPFKSYLGHASHVTNVTFCQDDSTVVTLGGNDKALIQWQFAQ